MIEVIIALLGVAAGMLIANYTKEEMVTGRKYLILAERISFSIILLFVTYNFVLEKMFLLLVSFILLMISLFIIKDQRYALYGKISVFTGIFFLLQNFQLLFASLLFIYFLIIGSLLRK